MEVVRNGLPGYFRETARRRNTLKNGSWIVAGNSPKLATSERKMVASPESVTEIRYIIRPNRSMDRRQAGWLVVSIAAVSFAVAGSLALSYGAWPILPFAGLEMALLAYVIWRVQAHSENEELLVLGASYLDLTRRSGRQSQSHRFNRYWVRVNLRKSRARNIPSRLEIGSHGKFVEIGSFLTDDERVSLANSLLARLAGGARDEHGLKSTGES